MLIMQLNCMFPILDFIKRWKPSIAKYPINNAGMWTFPYLFTLLLCIDFCTFLVQVSGHVTFPIESRPRDYTGLQLKAFMIEHIIE